MLGNPRSGRGGRRSAQPAGDGRGRGGSTNGQRRSARRRGRGVQPGDWVLIHVGFALSKVDEQEARATHDLLVRMGRELRAGARGAEGERDRVTAPGTCTSDRLPEYSPGICTSDHCITCADDGVPMTVLHIDEPGGLAVCCGEDGVPSSVEIALVEPVALGDVLLVHAGTAIARIDALAGTDQPIAETDHRIAETDQPTAETDRRVAGSRSSRPPARRGARVKFVDEYRDAALGQALSGEILSLVEPGAPVQAHGGVRRPHAHDLQVRHRRSAACERRARARPRLPGVRDPDGSRRRRDRARRTSRA